jgi:hypothetical protein
VHFISFDPELFLAMKFFGGFFAKAVLMAMVLCASATLRVHANEVQLHCAAILIK